MAYRSTLFRSLRLACILTNSISFTAASAYPARDFRRSVFSRDSLTCPSGFPNSCQTVDPNLPGNFCCNANLHCISADSSSTAICCPTGSNCEQIEPIDCDVSLQDPSKNETSPVFTTKLNSPLQSCGNKCCPNGYTCDSTSDVCNIIISTSSLAPNFNQTQPSSTSAAPSGTSTTSAPSSTVSGIDSTTPQPSNVCEKFPGGAIAAGFFPGMVAGVLLMIFSIAILGYRSPQTRPNSNSSSLRKPFGTFRSKDGAIVGVSDPIPLQISHTRTDFLRRSATRAKSLFTSRENSPLPPAHTYPATGGNWKMPTPPDDETYISHVSGNRMPPVTPERQKHYDLHNQPSTESIRVYSPAPGAPPQSAITPSSTGTTLHPSSSTTTTPYSRPNVPLFGSPFKSPPSTSTAVPQPQPYHLPSGPKPPPRSRPNQPQHSPRASPESTLNDTLLTPARYNNGRSPYQEPPIQPPPLRKQQNPTRDEERGRSRVNEDKSRPTTTFTEMLKDIDFPDPETTTAAASSQTRSRPAVPQVPKMWQDGGRGR